MPRNAASSGMPAFSGLDRASPASTAANSAAPLLKMFFDLRKVVEVVVHER
jgi:hypothetical protein